MHYSYTIILGNLVSKARVLVKSMGINMDLNLIVMYRLCHGSRIIFRKSLVLDNQEDALLLLVTPHTYFFNCHY